LDYVRLLPKKSLSRVVGRLAQVEEPKWFVDQAKSWFVDRYKLNMAEAEKPLSEYKSLNALFTRRLKPGARPIGESVVHPCDGQLTQANFIEEGLLVQAKGIKYSLKEFLKDDQADEVFSGGLQLTYYLCPTDYHRVHAPVDAEAELVVHVPGQLWPVNPWSVENVSQLFCLNERVIFRLKTPLGPVALVMVGATNVGQIEVVFDSKVKTNQRGSKTAFRKTYKPAVSLKKGDELGVFHMGSSVVVVYPKSYGLALPSSGPVRLGESL
jgi:phosphatidylserine decarboxylase